jgi:hypothetical protein
MAICEKYVTAMKALGRNIWLGGEKTPTTAGASTDQGNIDFLHFSLHYHRLTICDIKEMSPMLLLVSTAFL